MHAFKSIGLLETETKIVRLHSWTDFARSAVEAKLGVPVQNDTASILSALRLLTPIDPELLDALAYLGIIPQPISTANSSSPAASPPPPIPLPRSLPPHAPIDLFASVLAYQLRYLPGERDLVILHHEIVTASAHGASHSEEEPEEHVHSASLTVYGNERASAMARCVGLPLAFAVRAVLEGAVVARGVCGPGVEKAVWGRVLDGLEGVGMGMRESVRVVKGGGVVEKSLLKARMTLVAAAAARLQ